MEDRHGGVEERRLDKLAPAAAVPLEQREQDPQGGVHAGGDVDQRYADPQRAARPLPVDAHQTRNRLDGGIVSGHAAQRAIIAIAGDAAVHQAGEALGKHRVMAEAPFLERAGLEILDENVSFRQEIEQGIAAARTGEIEDDAPLVAIDAEEVGGCAFVERRSPCTGLVAMLRFDLDDVGAMVAEDLRAVGTAEHAGEIDDANAVKGA